MVSEELLSRYFETRARFMHKLEKLEEEYLTKYYWMLDHIKVFLPRNPSVQVLVLGCGLGHEVYALSKMGYKNVLGVDIDCKQVEICRAKGINCICADAIEYLEKTDETYDVILMFNLLEHFDLDKALKLCNLCHIKLAENGRLILSVPNAANPFATYNIYGDLTHRIGAFTETSIVQLLKAAGFSRVIVSNVKTFGRYDHRVTKRILKIVGTIIIHITRQIIRLMYLLNGISPPKVVSSDLLAIAIK